MESDHLLTTFRIFYFVCSSKLFDKMVKRLHSTIGKHLRLIGVIKNRNI